MADYCNKCALEILGDKAKPEIDVYNIASFLCNGCIKHVLCEGCEMVGVYKDGDGNIFVLYEEYTRDGLEFKKVSVKEWEKVKPRSVLDDDGIKHLIGIQGSFGLGENTVKIIPGRDGGSSNYHVIVEDSRTGENRYSYLSNQEILDKFGISTQTKI